jgi:hypothetical protein
MDLDTPLIAALIARTALCAECIARPAGIPPDQVDAAIRNIRRCLEVTSRMATCDGCLTRAVVHRLD